MVQLLGFRWYRKGDWLIGCALVRVDAGAPIVLEARANIRRATELLAPKIAAAHGVGWFGSSIVKKIKHAVKKVTRAKIVRDIGRTVQRLGKKIGKVPVIGQGLHATLAVTPIGLAQRIASGARIDRAVYADFRDKLKAAHAVAPYASTVVSFVPGIGTGAAAAIAAGAALAEGRSITAAAEAAIRASIPGGALAQGGFDLAKRIATGQNLSTAALAAARARLPAGARQAFDVGLAVAHGKSLQGAMMKAAANMAPAQMREVLAVGERALAATPALKQLSAGLRSAAARSGVKLAAGLLSQAGANDGVLATVRRRLTGDLAKGFELALASQAKHNGAALRALVAVRQAPALAKAAQATQLAEKIAALNAVAQQGGPAGARAAQELGQLRAFLAAAARQQAA